MLKNKEKSTRKGGFSCINEMFCHAKLEMMQGCATHLEMLPRGNMK
jgi:hypothetical protein